jgi:hypothetical protein
MCLDVGPISAAVKTLNKVIKDLLILLLLQASGQQANVVLRRFASATANAFLN